MYADQWVLQEGLFDGHTHTRYHISRNEKTVRHHSSEASAAKEEAHRQLFLMAMRHQAEAFAHGIHMPNLREPSKGDPDPILFPSQVRRHNEAMLAALPEGCDYIPYSAVQLYDYSTSPMIAQASVYRCRVLKAYMPGVTNSGYEVTDFFTNRILGVLEKAAKVNMVLSLHLGRPSHDLFEETRLCCELLRELVRATRKFGEKGLKIVVEHIPDWETLEAVLRLPLRVGGTLTIPHLTGDASLFWDRVLGKIINPFAFAKPVMNHADDRRAMIEALRDPKTRRRLWLGTDNAPHPASAKLADKPSPGIWMPSRVIISKLITLFEKKRLPCYALTEFACLNGPAFYDLSVPRRPLRFRRDAFEIPDRYPIGDTGEWLVPFGAGEECQWQFERVSE